MSNYTGQNIATPMTKMDALSESIPKFTISFDFEIGWGDVTNGVWKKREARGTYKKLRRVLPAILEEMRVLEFPATWATVGGMVAGLDNIEVEHLPQEAKTVVRESLNDGLSSSFDGRDLFETLLSHQSTGHRIACHSYSHVPFNFNEMCGSAVLSDLELAKRAYEAFGISTDVFVFPENIEKYHEEIFKSGFKLVRTQAKVDMSNRLRYLANTLIVPPPFAIESTRANGLAEQSGSMLFNMGVGKAYRMPFVYRRALSGLRNLVKSDSELLHIWIHPFNLAESDYLYRTFVRFLRRVVAERDEGKLEIVTM